MTDAETTTLEHRTLGRTGLDVTRLGYGAMEIRGARTGRREVSEQQAETILEAVLAQGINFIDTAACYGDSEAHIGRVLADRRSEFVLATKAGCWVVDAGDHDDTPHSFEREHLLENLEESLRRLRTDHVDILQLHNPTVAAIEEHGVMETVREIKESGKASFVGISSRLPDLADYAMWEIFDIIQIPYSALDRKHERLIGVAHDRGAGVIVRPEAQRGSAGEGLGSDARLDVWSRARLDELLEPGESRARFLTRFAISHPGLDTYIMGTLQPAHLAENIADVNAGALAADVYAEAKRRLDEAGSRAE
ncbi:aldo/keto reductase [Compostimonas suwonensis]|uniref:Aryl-alcohol dehydrogenase-like predicted oxidoreductase n=1 Tax=Compostimonas suwonensis TaxID=1048394 RepID=A0A2M9BVV9_9MICO|nr:aldo/keto reductase [Compostimonas suwonensis]PJJ62086.1 aryl-alcohol dehydrogenase-like predicted oxidoreductase [Compostimonas suwonensis]